MNNTWKFVLLKLYWFSLSSSSATFSFTWDDAFRISQPQTATQHRSTYLQAFFHKVQLCNRAPVSSYHCLLCFLGNTNNEDKLVYWEFETPNCAFVHHPLYFPIKLFLFGFWNMGLANVGDHKFMVAKMVACISSKTSSVVETSAYI